MSNGSETPQYSGNNKGLPKWVWVLLAIPLVVAPFVKRERAPLTRTGDNHAALNLTLTDTAGNKQTLADYRGKTVLFSFWASWCGPCLAEMPALGKLEAHFKGQPFQLILVNVDETLSDVRGVLKVETLPGKVFFGGTADTLHALGVQSIPFTLLIDAEGKIRDSYLGEQDWEDPAKIKAIEKWLGATPK